MYPSSFKNYQQVSATVKTVNFCEEPGECLFSVRDLWISLGNRLQTLKKSRLSTGQIGDESKKF